MTRCLIESNCFPGEEDQEVTLSREESRHLSQVLRARPGQEFEVFDGRGNAATAVIIAIEKKSVRARILSHTLKHDPEPCPRITLFQAIPKHPSMELLLRQTTELGISTIFPLVTENSVTKPKSASQPRRQERWDKIVANAAKQCNLNYLPRVFPVCRMEEIAEHAKACDTLLIGSLQPEAIPAAKAVREKVSPDSQSVGIAIGPEGDFTIEEIRMLEECGGIQVSFSQYVLRVATAAICAVGIVSHEIQS